MPKVAINDQSKGSVANNHNKENEVHVIAAINECSLVQSTANQSNWLLDSGATNHVTNDLKLLMNACKPKQFVKVGNCADAEATFVGQVDMIVEDNK
jgi:hypothetical protein